MTRQRKTQLLIDAAHLALTKPQDDPEDHTSMSAEIESKSLELLEALLVRVPAYTKWEGRIRCAYCHGAGYQRAAHRPDCPWLVAHRWYANYKKRQKKATRTADTRKRSAGFWHAFLRGLRREQAP